MIAKTLPENVMRRLTDRLADPVNNASIGVFRICFGVVMLWEVIRYFQFGWIDRYYIAPQFHFSYYGLDWIKPLTGSGMVVVFSVLGVLSICIAAGLCYRIATPLFFVAFTYLFLCEEARWLNHFYLIGLLSFLLIFIPAHRRYSLDALIWPRNRSRTGSNTVGAWALWALRTQLALVYSFGAIAKMNADWLHGQPMGMWLAERTDFPLIGPLFTLPAAGLFFSYGGLLFDLLFVPLVLWKRTRWIAFSVGLLFHLLNSRLFDIGIFPFMMIAANFLFLSPDWPERFWQWIRRTGPTHSDPKLAPSYKVSPLLMIGLGVYFVIQVAVPLRHFLYPGDVNWTQQADRFSWRMKLNDLRGDVLFWVTDSSSGETWPVQPDTCLADWQIREMIQRPDMILQFSHFLAEQFRANGKQGIEVRADAMIALNGRPPQPLIDPDVDLAAQPRTLTAASWLLPVDL